MRTVSAGKPYDATICLTLRPYPSCQNTHTATPSISHTHVTSLTAAVKGSEALTMARDRELISLNAEEATLVRRPGRGLAELDTRSINAIKLATTVQRTFLLVGKGVVVGLTPCNHQSSYTKTDNPSRKPHRCLCAWAQVHCPEGR